MHKYKIINQHGKSQFYDALILPVALDLKFYLTQDVVKSPRGSFYQ